MCEYCDAEDCTEALKRKSVSVLGVDIDFEAFLSGENILFCTVDNYEKPIIKAKIKYCPMCGRKLNTD